MDAMVVQAIASGRHACGDNPAVLQALQLLAPKRAGELLECTVKANAAQGLGACVALVGLAVTSPLFTGRTAAAANRDLHAAASTLVVALPGDPVRPASTLPTWQQRPIDEAVVADLMLALWCVDAALADRAAGHLLAWPATYGLDALLVPAARRWMGHTAAHTAASFQRLLAACLAHLQARAVQPLAPPADCGHANAACRVAAATARHCRSFWQARWTRCGSTKQRRWRAATL